MKKHSVSIGGHATSFSIEDEFHVELRRIAKSEHRSVAALIASIDAERPPRTNLSSAIRLHVLRYLLDRAKEAG